jgi:hypothetical protein
VQVGVESIEILRSLGKQITEGLIAECTTRRARLKTSVQTHRVVNEATFHVFGLQGIC